MIKLVFIIPPGSPVLPFIQQYSIGENEIILPHGTQVVYERALGINQSFDVISTSTEEGKGPEIGCFKSDPVPNIHVFRVLHDPWEVKAALNYNPLNYNLYGTCLDSVSAQTGASVEAIKKLSEQYLFQA